MEASRLSFQLALRLSGQSAPTCKVGYREHDGLFDDMLICYNTTHGGGGYAQLPKQKTYTLLEPQRTECLHTMTKA